MTTYPFRSKLPTVDGAHIYHPTIVPEDLKIDHRRGTRKFKLVPSGTRAGPKGAVDLRRLGVGEEMRFKGGKRRQQDLIRAFRRQVRLSNPSATMRTRIIGHHVYAARTR